MTAAIKHLQLGRAQCFGCRFAFTQLAVEIINKLGYGATIGCPKRDDHCTSGVEKIVVLREGVGDNAGLYLGGTMATSAHTQAEQQSEASGGWSLSKRIGFRFVFLYLALYNVPFPIGWIPGTDALYGAYSSAWHQAVPWIGRHILHLSYPITVFTNGSGDTTYDWVMALCFLLLTVVGVLLWSILGRKAPNYQTLHAWLTLGLRMLLAGTMMLFGSVKVFQVQFQVVSLTKMLQPYGDSSPMGLLWTFMGASPGYSLFTGIVEMLGGVLLLFPRLTTLGGLISLGAMANVFALNLAYDVPVKLYSLHVLLMITVLLAPEFQRLANVFIFNRPAGPANYPPLFASQRSRNILMLAQLLFGLYIFSNGLYQAYKVDGRLQPRPPHCGIWAVDNFIVDGQTHPPLLTDQARWRQVVFDDIDTFTIESVDGQAQHFRFELSGDNITLTKGPQENWTAPFRVKQPSPDTLTLDGQMDGQHIQASLRKIEPKFVLTTRGFHWITEYPFRR